jgi:hypothetical protein
LAISVCKIPFKKTFHTEIAKIAKQWTENGSMGSSNPKSVFVTFAISVCKIPFRKDVPHGDREDRNETDELRIEGPHNPNRSLRPSRSLCVKAR